MQSTEHVRRAFIVRCIAHVPDEYMKFIEQEDISELTGFEWNEWQSFLSGIEYQKEQHGQS